MLFLHLCFDLRETNIDCAELFDCTETLQLREEQNQASLVHYFIVGSLWVKSPFNSCSYFLFSSAFSYATKWMSRRERQEKLGNQIKKFTNVYVKNFGEDMDEARFKELVDNLGKVLSLKVVTSDGGRSKGFGFVSFETPEEAQKVMSVRVLI